VKTWYSPLTRDMHASTLFQSISPTDHLGLFHGDRVAGDKVASSLGYKKREVSRAARVPLPSVRYDAKMPAELAERLREWAVALNLVASFFKDKHKTLLWFHTPNPLLGGLQPREMILMGRAKLLLSFIQTALDENATP